MRIYYFLLQTGVRIVNASPANTPHVAPPSQRQLARWDAMTTLMKRHDDDLPRQFFFKKNDACKHQLPRHEFHFYRPTVQWSLAGPHSRFTDRKRVLMSDGQ
jgi:hypothetical protein